ncbi:MAX gene-associated protein [Orchesella cincta]|uniref:MAX gene-associated protein n=1 Tax=Orchesella cincta TaxID=48709 RepID=A0A1D2MUM9_ORCCI|nr:MAX gene-associated protein [Orchesella cincta]
MDTNIDSSPSDKELETPPTLVAESDREKISGGGQARINRMASVGDEQTAKMPVLQPNVNIEATRTKSGRIHKPARNFNSDEYVVPALTKRRIPNNSRAHLQRTQAAIVAPAPTSTALELESIRSKLEEKFPKAASDVEETPFTFIISVCFKDKDPNQNLSVTDIHSKVKDTYKNWTKGPYKLRDEEIKFLQECIIKPEWSRISMREWRILAEALKDRMYRMRRRFSKGGRYNKVKAKKSKEDMRKCFVELSSKIVRGAADDENSREDIMSEDEFDDLVMEDDMGDVDYSSSHSSRLSIKSKDPMLTRSRGNSKTPSLANDESKDVDYELSRSSVGLDDITNEDLKEEMFDDLDSALVNESLSHKVGEGNSMVAALHATLQNEGDPQFDPSQYEPHPGAFEKDSSMFALEDMEVDNSCNFFENIEEPSFENAEAAAGLSDEAFAALEQRVMSSPSNATIFNNQSIDGEPRPSTSGGRYLLSDNRLDLSAVEIEESSGNVKINSNGDLGNPGVTMISTKTALMCALKISEDFLPSSHEKYLDRLEETEKYHHHDLDDIRKKFNMKPSALAAKRKLAMVPPKPKAPGFKAMNGADKQKPHPYLRSAYAKCRKFMEDETTVIEKLGSNKILAAGQIIEVDYEHYLKESDIEIPMDDKSGPMPTLPPPSVSNCHAPSCRLGCICASISEDMPPRKHCGRSRCFFECNCQQLLFNSNDDGDIRSRLRPRVSLLNWRAETTEKEKEPMTSYRQMERGTHFIRVRRTAVQPERLRREFVLDGKVVDRTAAKVSKERMRTKALVQSSHRRILNKPEGGHRFVRIVPAKTEQKKAKADTEKLLKKCNPLTVDVEHLDIDISVVDSREPVVDKREKFIMKKPLPPTTPSKKMSAKDIEEMKSIIQEMTEDCQLFGLEDSVGLFSWSKGTVHPKVVMYQVMMGDEFRIPWLYLPIPPQGYSWICHNLNSSFERTDYVYIPEMKCCIPSQALRVNMNTAFTRKKAVVFDVKADGRSPDIGKIYFFPNLPKVLVCGPFKTDETTTNPRDLGTADQIAAALQHLEKMRLMKHFGDDKSWKRFTSAPTIFPIKRRNDNETTLSSEDSRKLFAQIYPSLMQAAPVSHIICEEAYEQPAIPTVTFDWSNAVKFVGFGSTIPNHETTNLANLISMNM